MSTIKVNGVELHHDLRGDGDPVVFLNGILMTAQSWVLQTALLQRHFRCVLHDFRGQMLSDKPPGPYSMELHADDLAGLLDELGIGRCHLVGTSYGGVVGMVFAATRPERVRSLTVITAGASVGPLLRRQVELWAETARRDPAGLYRLTIPFSFSEGFLAKNGPILKIGEKRIRRQPPEFFEGFVRLVECFLEVDLEEHLPKVRCPSLVLGAGEDLLNPPERSRELARRIAQAEHLLVPDAGHAVIIEKPDAVNTALLGFLEKWR